MTNETIDTARDLLSILDGLIKSAADGAEDLRRKREQVWRTLDEAGVKRNQIALWSNIGPMMVSRALKAE